MKRLTMDLLIYFILFFTYTVNAANENHTLHVNVTNETKDKLQFKRVEGSNPGNHFIITSQVIDAGESSVITVEKLENIDIAGKVVFTNSADIETNLIILDQEQVHMGQPIFSVSGKKHFSKLVSKTRNKNVGPRYLTYLQANLRIFENSTL